MISKAQEAELNNPTLVQSGFGRDESSPSTATSAAVRACRNALAGQNSWYSPIGKVDHYLRCYPQQLDDESQRVVVHVRLGVPDGYEVDAAAIQEAFPYGRLLPLEVVTGGLSYSRARGRVRTDQEPRDRDDTAIVVVAAVSIQVREAAALDRIP